MSKIQPDQQVSLPRVLSDQVAANFPLEGEDLVVGYGDKPVLNGVNVGILAGELTVIVGPNACGKSTLLRSLARVLPAQAGQVKLGGKPIKSYQPKQIARRLGLLPQSPVAPDGITVFDLVARGRYPHQSLLKQWSVADEKAVEQALCSANVNEFRHRHVNELSGGQRQRVWIAMSLAQETPILLLDEPTTYLDIAHQLEVLELAAQLQREGRTVVVVLHDLNFAFRYATHLIVMRDGKLIDQGKPNQIVTPQLIEQAFNVPCQIMPDPVTGTPMVIALRATHSANPTTTSGNNLDATLGPRGETACVQSEDTGNGATPVTWQLSDSLLAADCRQPQLSEIPSDLQSK